MEARLSTVLFLIACVPSIFGFVVPAPPGIGSSMESSYESLEVSANNNPGLLILNGPVAGSNYEPIEPVESEIESIEPAEPSIESEFEPVESSDVRGGTGQAATGQAGPNSAGSPAIAGGGVGISIAGGNSPAQTGAGGQARSPQQISSTHPGRAAGVAVAVGACFLVVVAIGVAAYVIRQQRRTRNEPERLQ